ncbi:MAG: hypothetical protein V3U29_05830 [Phycisphaeraceae bacterium]
MRWLTFAIFVYVMLAAEIGLRPLVGVPYGASFVGPSLMLILFVHVAMSAPPLAVAWAALVIGLLVDLTHQAPIVGPAALAYLLGAYVAMQLRVMVFRDSALSLAAMTFAVGVFVHLAVVFLLVIRGLPFLPSDPLPDWDAPGQLVFGFFELLYTTAASIPVGMLLRKLESMWALVPNTIGR